MEEILDASMKWESSSSLWTSKSLSVDTFEEAAGLPGSQAHTGQYGVKMNYAQLRERMVPIIATHVLHPFSTVCVQNMKKAFQMPPTTSGSKPLIWIPPGSEALKI